MRHSLSISMPVICLTIIILLYPFAPLSANDNRLEKISLQLNWKYQFQFAGFIAAKEKGFYKEVGLDVELLEYQNGIDIVSDVLKQKAHFGIHHSRRLSENRNRREGKSF